MKTILVKFVKPHGITWIPNSEKEYRFLVHSDYTLFVGDVIESQMYSGYMLITNIIDDAITYYDGKAVKELKHFSVVERKTLTIPKQSKPMKTNMFASVIEKYKSQFIPVEEKNIRITIDGNIAIKVNNEYRAINKEDEITSYAEEMCFDFPVWSINKLYNKVVVGDIIYAGDQYAKVISINNNGTLRCLTYNGDVTTQREIKDFFIKQPFVKTIVNMFSGISTDFNPMMLAFMGDDVDMKDLIMIQMMQGQQNINPMMLLLMNKDKNDNKALEMMLMMQMMQGNNPFDAFITK
jgi:hypothetical protein